MLEIFHKLSAAPFRPSKRYIRKCFDHFNQDIFDGALEPYRSVTWLGSTGRNYGTCHGKCNKDGKRYWILGMSREYPSFIVFATALLHELVHAYQWLTTAEMNHGPSFFKWRNKIQKAHFPLETKTGKQWKVTTHR